MKARLILEDGTVFTGKHIGADKDVISEIVFNTSMAGYTEVFTDPSYAGQAVCMTYPLIGNYGVCLDDMESEKPWVDAIIVRELSHVASNFRCDMTVQEFMDKFQIPGIEGIDTRALVRLLRDKGTMNGLITTNESLTYDQVKEKLHAYTTGDVVSKVSCKEKKFLKGVESLSENGPLSGSASFNKEDYEASLKGDLSKREKRPAIVKELNGRKTRPLKIALLDLGAKKNIADSLAARGCDVTIYPFDTSAEEILRDKPDGIMLSNGPGDPKDCRGVIEEIKKLYASDVPIFAICLGHQLMALATGADTFKLKYGHRGGNHPVKDLTNGRVYISSQNHGYVVDMDKLDRNVAEPAFINVNDGTNEGLKYVGKNIFTVQFHPEACPGPQDSSYLFDRFINMCEE
ncbi:carbamoyl phosphate synthase small subunit [Butyrivibrio sp. INlla14]|uniref:carbamoyl phosphate synthase small subunit n=1 Tax=Butyrivibrio sp. INlla14 TaxID=1520808 RepID=UPI000876EBF1|nr:carbamoyl phosphate synthase small subunit [Butyrivibrio sp. INlla14]SCY66088.1 carbamoyl-phosphate synthase small subunit [Butyrivibrio sp. INlla14]